MNAQATVTQTYRCTRNECYPQNTKGYKDINTRQSHYVNATSVSNAISQMFQMFPHDTQGFTVELWSN